jgi:hypothetical protein
MAIPQVVAQPEPLLLATEERYSLNRLAVISGWPEVSLRRLISSTDAAELMDMVDLGRAVVAARALRVGHATSVIRTINALPYLTSSMWLASAAGQTPRVSTSLLKITAYIEDHPASSWLLSPMGLFIADVDRH